MAKQTTTIAVLGAGSWGTALAMALARNDHQVLLWDRDSDNIQDMKNSRVNNRYLPDYPLAENIHPSDDLTSCVTKADEVLLVIPSHGFRATLQQVVPNLNNKQRLFWATKGIDADGNCLLHEVVQQECGEGVTTAILSGPSFAKEVAAGLPTAVTVASSDDDFAQTIQALFSNQTFRIYTNRDVIGVELGGAVKNVVAIAAGVADGLKFGANSRSALITRSLVEMTRLGDVMGAKHETFMGLAGLGDLILTCTDNQSRNRRFGLALGQGVSMIEAEQQIGQVVEGIRTSEQVWQLAQKHKIEMPITEQVHALIQGKVTPKQAFDNLLSRALKAE